MPPETHQPGVPPAHTETYLTAHLAPSSATDDTLLPPVSGDTVGSAPPTLSGYEILGELGRGGMGVVYKARHVQLNRLVALKMILHGDHAGKEALARFRAEAEAVAALQHPNIVQVFEIGEHDGKPFCALEYLEGGSLAQKISDKPLSPREAATLVETLARAMQHGHEKGIVHRDLKPANVLLASDGTPKITDFGLVKRMGGESSHTHTGAIMGTPSYMAPEQAAGQGKEVGPAADVYALGAILYDLLTGRPPFKAATLLETLEEVRVREPLSPVRLQPRCPRDLETIVLKCLEKEPRRRYPSAGELADDLKRFLAGEPIQARRVGTVERLLKWASRHPAVAALSLFSLVVTLAGVTLVALQWREAVAARDEAQAQTVRANRALGEAETQLYVNSVTLAEREWQANRLPLAEESLDRAPVSLRHWEWHYLKRLCQDNGLVLPGFAGFLGPVAFSPDGQRLAAGGSDIVGEDVVKIWDALSGKQLHTFYSPGRVTDLAFSVDGSRLAFATWAGPRVLEIETERVLLERKGASDHIVWGGDKRLVAFDILTRVEGMEGTFHPAIRVHDLQTGKDILSLPPSMEKIKGLALSQDGKRVAVTRPGGKTSGITQIFDIENGKEVLSLEEGKPILRFAPDGKTITRATAFLIDKRELPSGKVVTASFRPWTDPSSVYRVAEALSVDGTVMAAGGEDGLVRLWRTAGGNELTTYRGLNAAVNHLAFSPDGKRLAVSAGDGFLNRGGIRVWDVSRPQEYRQAPKSDGVLKNLSHGFPIHSPDGRHFAVKGQLVEMFTKDKKPDGLWVSDSDKGWELWDITEGKMVLLLRHEASVRALCFNRDGSLAATGGEDGKVRVWDVSARKEKGVLLGHTTSIKQMSFHSDGRLFTLDSNYVLRVWDVESGKELLTLRGAHYSLSGIVFSPDGRYLATSGETSKPGFQRLCLWNTENAEPVRPLKDESSLSNINVMAFDPQGKWLAAGSGAQNQPGMVQVWDTLSGESRFVFKSHSAGVTSLVFSADGKRLVSHGWGGWNKRGEMKIWDLVNGRELLTLETPCASPELSFSKDGRQLLARDVPGGTMGPATTFVWDATPVEP